MTSISPGSIKARILEAIIDLGDAATSHAIRKRHPSNEALVDNSLGQLSNEGYIRVTSEGNYELTPDARKLIKGQSINEAVAAIRSTAATARAESAAPAPAVNSSPQRSADGARECLVCKLSKFAADFYGKDKTCSRCRLDESKRRQEERRKKQEAAEAARKSLEPTRSAPAAPNGHASTAGSRLSTTVCLFCEERKETTAFAPGSNTCLDCSGQSKPTRARTVPALESSSSAPPAAPEAPRSASPSTPTEQTEDFLIPASGSITCRNRPEGIALLQEDELGYNNEIFISAGQLERLIERLTKRLGELA